MPPGKSLGLVTRISLPVSMSDAVDGVRRGGDQRQVELALQPLADDLHVQQAEEAAAEAEPERVARLRLVQQRGVVQPQLVQRVAQVRVVIAVHRVQAGEDHRLGRGVARQRLRRRAGHAGHGVADPRLPHVLHPGDQVADLSGGQALARYGLGRDHSYLERLVRRAGGHHHASLAPGQAAVDHPDIGHHAAVGVVDRVEDEGPGGGIRVSLGGGNEADDLLQEFLDAFPGLGGHPEHLAGVAADDPGEFGGVAVGLGGRQVDLVQHRDDLEVGVERHVQVGQRLRLDALGRVDQQDRALAGRQAAGDLIAEVDVAGGVDQVKHVLLVVAGPREAGRPGS